MALKDYIPFYTADDTSLQKEKAFSPRGYWINS